MTNQTRVTSKDVENAIQSEWYFTGADGAAGAALSGVTYGEQPPVPAEHPLRLVTFCVLILKNGYSVDGAAYCVSPENFEAALGRKYAREKALEKIYPVLGYELKSKLNPNKEAWSFNNMLKEDEEDFLSSSKACDLSGEGNCEACQ